LKGKWVYKTAYLPEDLSKFLFHRNRGDSGVGHVTPKTAAKKKQNKTKQKQKPQSRISNLKIQNQ
jgi:hypothetical protein